MTYIVFSFLLWTGVKLCSLSATEKTVTPQCHSLTHFLHVGKYIYYTLYLFHSEQIVVQLGKDPSPRQPIIFERACPTCYSVYFH